MLYLFEEDCRSVGVIIGYGGCVRVLKDRRPLETILLRNLGVQLQARKQPTFMILLFLSHCDYHSHKRIQLQAHTQRSSPAAGTRAANLHDIIIIMSM